MATAAVRKNRYSTARATYGSVAYDLDYAEGGSLSRRAGEETLRPRPLVRPRERAAVRPKVRVREAGSVSLFAVIGFLTVGIFATMFIMGCAQLAAYSDDIASLDKQLTALQSEESRLRTEYKLAFDLSGIEQDVTADGGMVKPQTGQIIYIDLSEPDSVVLFEEAETPITGVQGALAGLKQVFDNIVEYFR